MWDKHHLCELCKKHEHIQEILQDWNPLNCWEDKNKQTMDFLSNYISGPKANGWCVCLVIQFRIISYFHHICEAEKLHCVSKRYMFLYRHLHPRQKYKTEQIILHQNGREHRGNWQILSSLLSVLVFVSCVWDILPS